MKKKTLLLMLTLLMSINSWGAKAFPGPYTFTQPDGTRLSVTLHGDEYFSYYTTLDGVILVREGNTFYIAEISDEGDIKGSGILAHNNGARSSSEIALIQQQDKGKLFNRNTIKRAIRKVPVAGGTESQLSRGELLQGNGKIRLCDLHQGNTSEGHGSRDFALQCLPAASGGGDPFTEGGTPCGKRA